MRLRGYAALGLGALALLAGLEVARRVALGPEPGGIDETYAALFGPPDQGPVDFETLTRRPAGNDALIAPAEVTPRAAPDLAPPLWAIPGPRLAAALGEVAREGVEAAELVFAGTDGLSLRFIARTPVLRFPDTIDARIVERGPDLATLALYSRSLIGQGDGGTNLKRMRAWLARLEARLPPGR